MPEGLQITSETVWLSWLWEEEVGKADLAPGAHECTTLNQARELHQEFSGARHDAALSSLFQKHKWPCAFMIPQLNPG